MGNGLKMICKAYGGMTVTDNGKTKTYFWDYKRDCAVDADELKAEAKKRKEERKAFIERSKRSVKHERLPI